MDQENVLPETSTSITDRDIDKELVRSEADKLLSDLPDIERLLDTLVDPRKAEPAVRRDIELKLAQSGSLRFILFCTSRSGEELAGVLGSAQIPAESMERIKAFARKYRFFNDVFVRIYRTEQGYENEITQVVFQPILFLKGRKVGVGLEVHSYDKLLFTSREELGELLKLVTLLMDGVDDALEYANGVNKDLAAEAVDKDTLEEFSRVVDRLASIVGPLRPEGAASNPPAV